MIKGFLNIPYFVWAALAIVVAVIFVYVGPHNKLTDTTGFRYFIIRWGHAATWILLAIGFALRGMSSNLIRESSFFSMAGGATYLLFLLMTFVMK